MSESWAGEIASACFVYKILTQTEISFFAAGGRFSNNEVCKYGC